jgi:hypothetical protein
MMEAKPQESPEALRYTVNNHLKGQCQIIWTPSKKKMKKA